MSDLDDLALLLHEKTLAGKLKWQLAADDRVTTRQGNNIIEIFNAVSQYHLFLKNHNGIVLSHETYQLASKKFELTKELFTKARRDALGIDEAISDVRQRLLHL